MKQLIVSVIAAVLALGGCAVPGTQQPANGSAVSTRADNADTQQLSARGKRADSSISPEKSRTGAGLRSTLQLRTGVRSESMAIPDAVIKVDPNSGRLTAEMESRLQKIADEAKLDERIIVRLESYVPTGGSPALNLGIADKTAQTVKDRLQVMGIPARRLLLASFGAEHDEALDAHRHWVEIFLLKTGHTNGHGRSAAAPTPADIRK